MKQDQGSRSLVHNENTPNVPRFLSQDNCRALIAEVQALGLTRADISLTSRWRGDVRWGRNRVSVASDWRDNEIGFGGWGVSTNQLDPSSLRAMIDLVQRDHRAYPNAEDFHPKDFTWPPATQVYPAPHIWSDRTYAQTPAERETIATQLIVDAERAGMLSAGFVSVEARGTALHLQDGLFLYAPQTLAQCSMTVRDPQGTGSGWAGASSYDWNRFDAAKLAAIALDKCLKSRNPVRIEPGRYTLIMEPQATFEFASLLMRGGVPPVMDRAQNEDLTVPVRMPFKNGNAVQYQIGRYGGRPSWDPTKIGQQIIDARLSITFDPLDSDLGVLPFTDAGDPYTPVTWFDKGVLTNLAYERSYALQMLQQTMGKPNSGAFRMDFNGPTATIEEMIATTKRGLLVTRLWGITLLDETSMLHTGLTRDGLWLIENGAVHYPVKNLRFTESPLFALNQVEQCGISVPVFSPEIPAMAPPLKVRDFSFTSLIDAV